MFVWVFLQIGTQLYWRLSPLGLPSKSKPQKGTTKTPAPAAARSRLACRALRLSHAIWTLNTCNAIAGDGSLCFPKANKTCVYVDGYVYTMYMHVCISFIYIYTRSTAG